MNNPSGQPAQPFAGAVPANTVLDNRYRLDGRIATGGMGEVWRGVDQTLGRPVAVKLLRPEYASDESFLVRFRGEARHAARLSHPGIASVYDYGEVATVDDHPTAYLVMELVEGEPLSAVLHREKRLSPERMLDVLGQAADALQAAHALNIVHRDIKPGNLLIRHDGVVKVTDFGIARAVDAAPLTATGIMMGTAYYVSPEQASGRPVTPASDVYSLGVVAYECLAGRRPFDDRNPIVVVMAHQQDNPPPLPGDVPHQVRQLVEQAMAKNPNRRPSSAGGFARSAAAIQREMFSPEPRWAAGAGGASPDMTARHPGPAGPPPRGRPRAASWLADGPAGVAAAGGTSTPGSAAARGGYPGSAGASVAPGANYPGQNPGGRGGPATSYQQGATGYPPVQPGGTGYQSPAGQTGYQQGGGFANRADGATGYQPGATGYQPGATGYQQGANGYQPGATGYQQPGATGYQPEQAGYQPAPTAYQPTPTSYQPAAGGWAGDDQGDETSLAAAHLAPAGELDEPAGWQPGTRAARRAGSTRAGAASGRRRRLSLPVLLVLLAITVVVCALITRSLAGSGGSNHAASSVTQAVTTGTRGGGIVVVEANAGD
ncbi:protein kinase [Frankia sp. AgB1.9]|uniref:serine/threonine-protein kinase n=1 Tax=unclassified Frankia TaxID=2632575 RepID=UPI001933C611|nr:MULTISPECIES: serine/threonine-protein kinase [unclassified Frankia]MBL7489903.1 protein kinase [Frankia sp. AgW1.1]MBL7549845.1 protein kinase [Frankia sp. AgB1.9]MBL7622798.1 protein kinase [Frankia sp. AgB1.8]